MPLSKINRSMRGSSADDAAGIGLHCAIVTGPFSGHYPTPSTITHRIDGRTEMAA
jgi:hypothetical protein